MIHITPAAAKEMRRLLGDRNRNGFGMRVDVQGSDRSGLRYTMNIVEQASQDDKVFEIEGLRIFCDPKSHLYLDGLTLDFNEELIGGGFQFKHPKTPRACQRGNSSKG